MTWLLDTNILSELRKGRRCHPRVAARFATVADGGLWLSALGLGEIRKGVESIRRRDAVRATDLEAWLARLLRDYADRVLPVDTAVADEWGRLTARRSASVIDTLLAATARVHGLTFVTRNVRDVAWTGVACIIRSSSGGSPRRQNRESGARRTRPRRRVWACVQHALRVVPGGVDGAVGATRCL